MSQKPSVGRIVHYHCPTNPIQPIAALVTAIQGFDRVWLTAFRPGSAPEPVLTSVPYGTEPGCWSWPERV